MTDETHGMLGILWYTIYIRKLENEMDLTVDFRSAHREEPKTGQLVL